MYNWKSLSESSKVWLMIDINISPSKGKQTEKEHFKWFSLLSLPLLPCASSWNRVTIYARLCFFFCSFLGLTLSRNSKIKSVTKMRFRDCIKAQQQETTAKRCAQYPCWDTNVKGKKMDGDIILVAVDASKEIADCALEWAVRNVARASDSLILLALLPSQTCSLTSPNIRANRSRTSQFFSCTSFSFEKFYRCSFWLVLLINRFEFAFFFFFSFFLSRPAKEVWYRPRQKGEFLWWDCSH